MLVLYVPPTELRDYSKPDGQECPSYEFDFQSEFDVQACCVGDEWWSG